MFRSPLDNPPQTTLHKTSVFPSDCFSPRLTILVILLTFAAALVMRLVELPYWDNPYYRLGDEHLLATHDAYHWTAGAAGFEFGYGHPMSELTRLGSWISGLPIAEAAFRMVPLLASFSAVVVALWGISLGFPFAGLAAGLLTALAPGFLGRTLLGYYDTDLITLLFPLILGLAPAVWLRAELRSPALLLRDLIKQPWWGSIAKHQVVELSTAKISVESVLSELSGLNIQAYDNTHSQKRIFINCALFAAGLFGFWTLEWHSLFPYLTRFMALLTLFIILVLGKTKRRLLGEGLLFALPMLNFPYGSIAGLTLLLCIILVELDMTKRAQEHFTGAAFTSKLRALFYPKTRKQGWLNTSFLLSLWGAVIWLCLSGDVWHSLHASIVSYLKIKPEAALTSATLTFPSVTQSIIEVHDLSLNDLLIYLHPWAWLAAVGVLGFLVALCFFPGLCYLLPLAVIAASSLKLGGRMAMFGAPIFSLGLFITLAAMLKFCKNKFKLQDHKPLNLTCAAIIGFALCLPALNKIPALSDGPCISQELAQALRHVNKNTPKESMLWVWWDWGYAAHHFAQRHAIADGARHDGPTLLLPAMVYATDNPYFARQVIKYAAQKGNAPDNFFAGLDAFGATRLLNELKNGPPVQAGGKQYLLVNFDLIPISLWVSYYGSWDFAPKKGQNHLVNNLDKDLHYNFNTGAVIQQELRPVYAASIDIFSSHGLQRRNYFKLNERHFIFNNRTQEKVVVDGDAYKSLLVQLLLCEPEDPRFSPYFKLVFDNVMTRVYEVL